MWSASVHFTILSLFRTGTIKSLNVSRIELSLSRTRVNMAMALDAIDTRSPGGRTGARR